MLFSIYLGLDRTYRSVKEIKKFKQLQLNTDKQRQIVSRETELYKRIIQDSYQGIGLYRISNIKQKKQDKRTYPLISKICYMAWSKKIDRTEKSSSKQQNYKLTNQKTGTNNTSNTPKQKIQNS